MPQSELTLCPRTRHVRGVESQFYDDLQVKFSRQKSCPKANSTAYAFLQRTWQKSPTGRRAAAIQQVHKSRSVAALLSLVLDVSTTARGTAARIDNEITIPTLHETHRTCARERAV